MKQFKSGSKSWSYDVEHSDGFVIITVYDGSRIDAKYQSPWLSEKGLLDFVKDVYAGGADSRLGLA